METLEPKTRIGQLREKAGLTQLELSQIIGVTETTIANWEKSRSGVEWIERIVKLCRVLDCNPNELIEYVHVAEHEDVKSKRKSLSELRNLIGTDQTPSVKKHEKGFKE